MTNIETAKANFARMLDINYTPEVINEFARDIRALVESDETTWDELGFTDNDVAERQRMVKVREMIYFFDMLNNARTDITASALARDIRAMVESGETTWDELGFTDSEVVERIQQTRVREAERNFTKMPDTDDNTRH